MHLSGNTAQGRADDIYLIANAHWESHDFALPALDQGSWCLFVDTARGGDDAIVEPEAMSPVEDPDHYRVESRSVVVLVSRGAGG
jgi:pullulanase/glycogen debranching enzyme